MKMMLEKEQIEVSPAAVEVVESTEPVAISEEDAIKGLELISLTVSRLALLNSNRETICCTAEGILDCLVGMIEVKMGEMKLNALRAFGDLSLAAAVGRDHEAWKLGCEAMIGVLSVTAAHSEDEICQALYGLKADFSLPSRCETCSIAKCCCTFGERCDVRGQTSVTSTVGPDSFFAYHS